MCNNDLSKKKEANLACARIHKILSFRIHKYIIQKKKKTETKKQRLRFVEQGGEINMGNIGVLGFPTLSKKKIYILGC
jgi:hypothetical protein